MVKSHTRQFIHLLLHRPRAHSSHALFKHIVYGPAHYESFVAQWLEHPTGVRKVEGSIGPLQLAIHVVQNRHAGEQKSHWDKTNKRQT